jgi:PBSX family phage portal protein
MKPTAKPLRKRKPVKAPRRRRPAEADETQIAVMDVDADDLAMFRAVRNFVPNYTSQDDVYAAIAKAQVQTPQPAPVAKAEAGDFEPPTTQSTEAQAATLGRLIGQSTIEAANVIRYPLDLAVLLASTLMNPYHSRALRAKRVATIGSGYTGLDGADLKDAEAVAEVLPDENLEAFVSDRNLFGNAYFEIEKNAKDEIVRLHHCRANTMFRSLDLKNWVQIIVPQPGTAPALAQPMPIIIRTIPKAKILHLHEYSPLSDYYGVPDWVSCLLHIMLAWESDDFRRKFYKNGAHAGVVVLLKGARDLSQEQRETIKSKFKDSKGAGNFRTIFVSTNHADAEIQIIGVAKEAPVRDDYMDIKQSTRESIITAHGLPARMMSIILDRSGAGIAGKVQDEMALFNRMYVEPEQIRLESFLSPLLPEPIKFKPFLLTRLGEDATDGDGAGVEPPLTPEGNPDDQSGELPKLHSPGEVP